MQKSDAKRSGGRVFRIDRECYIVYVGSDHHHVRPFLRVGTSPGIPDRIRQYIGTVVITDRLTGDPTQESTTVGPSVPRKPDYTGSHDLIRFAKPFFAAKRISERPIDAQGEDKDEGAFVEFLTDGALNVMVNGHRVFDLARREGDDRHGAYQLDRIARAVETASGRYRAEAFEPPGFLITPDRSLFFFRDGDIEARALRPKGVRALAERLVPLSLLTRFSGPVDTDGFLTLAKWAIRETSAGPIDRTIRLYAAGRLPGKLAPLVELLRAAGLTIEVAPVDAAFADLPSPAAEVSGVFLAVGRTVEWPQSNAVNLPEGGEWAGGVAPPVLPGVPYRLRSSIAEVTEADGTLESLADDRHSAHGLLARRLLALNEEGASTVDRAETARDVEQLLREAPIPLLADVYPTEVGYTVRFMVQHGFTLSDIRDNRRAVARIGAIAAEGVDEEFFLGERRRLLDFLDELLRQRRATVRKPAPPKPAKTDGTKKDAASTAGTSAGSAAGGATKVAPAAASTVSSGTPPSGVPSPIGPTGSGASSPTSRRPGVVPVAAAVGLFLLLAGGGAWFVFRARASEATSLRGFALARPADSQRDGGDVARDDDSTFGSEAPDFGEGRDAEPVAGDSASPSASGLQRGNESERGDPSSDDGPAGPSQPTSREATGPPEVSRPQATDGERSASEGAARRDPAGENDPGGAVSSTPPAASERPRDGGEAHVFDDALEITVLDVLLLVNEIAVGNDYAPIGDPGTVAQSPDWIYPGNVFTLPDGASYRVERGDTLWGIAEVFLRRSMNHNHIKLTSIAHRIDHGERPIDELEALIDAAHIESIRREARELIRQLEV